MTFPRRAVVQGTVRAITLRDINKARGHHTFNVELTLERPGEEPLTIRVAKVYWDRLNHTERAEIAPAPAPILSVERYGDWTVGEALSLEVELTSPGLAHPAR